MLDLLVGEGGRLVCHLKHAPPGLIDARTDPGRYRGYPTNRRGKVNTHSRLAEWYFAKSGLFSE
jgi:hypothetical protein